MSPELFRAGRRLLVPLLLALPACTDRPTEPRGTARAPAALYDERGDLLLVVGSTTLGVARLEVEVIGGELGERGRWTFLNPSPTDAEAWGVVALPTGKHELALRGFAEDGSELVVGSLGLVVDGELVPQVHGEAKPLGEPRVGTRWSAERFYAGSHRLAVSPRRALPGEDGFGKAGIELRAWLHGADGLMLPLPPEELRLPTELEYGALEVKYGGRELLDLILSWYPKFDPVPPPGTDDEEEEAEMCASTACGLVDIVLTPPPPPPDRYKKVVAHGSHTCALRTTGVAMCWGKDEWDVLAGGPSANFLAQHRFIDIDVNEHHGCGITTTGVAMCWGTNGAFELGRSLPQGIPSTEVPAAIWTSTEYTGTPFKAVTTGRRHSCALTVYGEVICWGINQDGQLGNGGGGAYAWGGPVKVKHAQAFTHVDAGDWHTCGIVIGGQVFCWGDVSRDQTGDGPEIDSPPDCPGYHQHQYGACRKTPGPVGTMSFVAISADSTTTCAVRVDRTVWCWGENIDGNVLPAQSPIPAMVSGANQPALVVGEGNACLFDPLGPKAPHSLTLCWGDDKHMQLGGGPGLASPRTQPVGMPYKSMAIGRGYACGVYVDGTALLCWGRTGEHLGYFSTKDEHLALRVTVF